MIVFASVALAALAELPLVDLSDDTNRQVIVAAGTETIYQGHPTTLLADDGKTMFCIWTYGHGGSCGPFARSEDAGLTWTRCDDLLPEPVRRDYGNCPTLQKTVGPDGKPRYLVFSAYRGKGLGIIVSDDLGRTWQTPPPAEHLSAHMPPTGFMRLKDGSCALFGQAFKSREKAKDRPSDDQAVWMSLSQDGGLTWGPARTVAQKENRNLCEPCCLRSPDGSTLCLLMRENRHQDTSGICFSKDEGKTWTAPTETVRGLAGDRHEAVYVPPRFCPDGKGRYVIAFRDQALGSATRGQFVAWVGTWDDLEKGRPGECRIRLLRHHPDQRCTWSKFDTGYPGVELLPDGTLVCTTYSRHWPDARQSSVVSMRFKLAEVLGRISLF